MIVNKSQKVYFNLGYFRIFQSLPNLEDVDIYINDKLVAEDLSYSNFTPYFPMVEDSYIISLYPANRKDTPILTNTLSIEEREFLTLATISKNNNSEFMAIPDINVPVVSNQSMLRFIHLSPDTPAVDIALPDGTILFRNISYTGGSEYLPVEPKNYTLQIREAGTPNVLLTVPNLEVSPNEYYTVYALGLSGGEPRLKGELLLDGFR